MLFIPFSLNFLVKSYLVSFRCSQQVWFFPFLHFYPWWPQVWDRIWLRKSWRIPFRRQCLLWWSLCGKSNFCWSRLSPWNQFYLWKVWWNFGHGVPLLVWDWISSLSHFDRTRKSGKGRVFFLDEQVSIILLLTLLLLFRDFRDSVGGELVLGGVNEERFVGDIHYVPVVRQAYWEIEIDEVTTEDGLPLGCTGQCTVSLFHLFVGV